MVATVMRDNELKIKNELPAANQVEKLDKKELVMYIYAGKPNFGYQAQYLSLIHISEPTRPERIGDSGLGV